MGIKLSGLTSASSISATDIMHLRTTGGIDKKITLTNFLGSTLTFTGIITQSGNVTYTGNVTFEGSSVFAKGVTPKGSLNSDSSQTYGDLYDALSSSIPDVDDDILLIGAGSGIYNVGTVFTMYTLTFSTATRTSETEIDVSYHLSGITWNSSTEVITGLSDDVEITVSNGDSTDLCDHITLSW